MPDRSHTVIFLAQLTNGELRTSRMIADIPMTADKDRYVHCAREFFHCFDAELISVTRVDEQHNVEVICGGDRSPTITHVNSKALRWLESVRSWKWWRFNAWATMTLLLVANLAVSTYHFAADTASPLNVFEQHVIGHYRQDGSVDPR